MIIIFQSGLALTVGQKERILKNFPSPPGPVPRKLRLCDAGRLKQEELFLVYAMKDKFQSNRQAPACFCCVSAKTRPLGLCLCCVNLVCTDCVINFSENEFKGCPCCETSWAQFSIEEVFIEAPVQGGAGLQPRESTKYRDRWMALLQKYNLLDN